MNTRRLADLAPPLATVAVSECLLGHRVRWDGDHNGDCWPRRQVAKLFTLVGLCPEAGIGMGIPRPPIRLVGAAENPSAVDVADPGLDYTARLQRYAADVSPVVAGVSGYIFADRSPSCGLAGVKVFTSDGSYRRSGRGIYATAVLAAHANLPAVDAETLANEATLLDFCVAVLRRGGHDASGQRLRAQLAPLIRDLSDWPARLPYWER